MDQSSALSASVDSSSYPWRSACGNRPDNTIPGLTICEFATSPRAVWAGLVAEGAVTESDVPASGVRRVAQTERRR